MLLARHAETVSNVEGRWQGTADSPLTERGWAQTYELAAAVAEEPLSAVYSSDLGRALATAEVVAERHGLRPIADPRLRELNVGAWTGRSGAELQQEQPEAITLWRTQPAALRLPDGETLAEVQARALTCLNERLAQHAPGETVMVIGHGTVNQTILVHALGGTVADLWLKQRVDNCQISRLTWTREDGLMLVELSDVRHLEAVGSLKTWRVTDDAASGGR